MKVGLWINIRPGWQCAKNTRMGESLVRYKNQRRNEWWKRVQLTRSRTMFASRPAGRISASDVHWESELEDIPGSDPDRRRFLEVGGRVTALDVEKVSPWDVTARGWVWATGGETGSWTCGGLKTRVSSLKRWGIGSEPLGAGTGRPDESVYVQSLDAKKLGNLVSAYESSPKRWSSPIAAWSWSPEVY